MPCLYGAYSYEHWCDLWDTTFLWVDGCLMENEMARHRGTATTTARTALFYLRDAINRRLYINCMHRISYDLLLTTPPNDSVIRTNGRHRGTAITTQRSALLSSFQTDGYATIR